VHPVSALVWFALGAVLGFTAGLFIAACCCAAADESPDPEALIARKRPEFTPSPHGFIRPMRPRSMTPGRTPLELSDEDRHA
jgi:hypothetical protein